MNMYKLMIVDDEQIVIDAITHIINKNIKNVTVVATARNGREAIEKAKANHPEIILMDIRMPGINGIDAISEIKRIYPDIRFAIIWLTNSLNLPNRPWNWAWSIIF